MVMPSYPPTLLSPRTKPIRTLYIGIATVGKPDKAIVGLLADELILSYLVRSRDSSETSYSTPDQKQISKHVHLASMYFF